MRALTRGAVLVHGSRIGVVWAIEGAGAVLLPVKSSPNRRRRSDVAIDDLAELLAMGLGGSERVVRSASPYRCGELASLVLIGRAPGTLLERIEMALRREAHVRAIEDGDVEPPEQERCVRL